MRRARPVGAMVRLFKHYVPHAVLLLGLIDCVLLLVAGELAWSLRASQIGMDPGALVDRLGMLGGFAAVVLAAMVAVGVYGSEALRSLRFAGARLLVAVSLAIIALAFLDFLLPGSTFWRSTLLYAMGLSIALLIANRMVVGGMLGAERLPPPRAGARRRRRARRGSRRSASGPGAASRSSAIVGMNDGQPAGRAGDPARGDRQPVALRRRPRRQRGRARARGAAQRAAAQGPAADQDRRASTSTISPASSSARPAASISTRSTRAG